MIAETRVITDNSAVYMKQLCRHFAHKVPAEFNDERGTVQFPFGVCELRAEAGTLIMRAESSGEAEFARLKHVIGDHFERFAFREDLHVEWSDQQ